MVGNVWLFISLGAVGWRGRRTPAAGFDPIPEPQPERTMPGLATPALPTISGLPAATPVKTDELGLPALP